MLIISGVFRVDPDLREAFLRSKEASMVASRAEPGCHDYVYSADPLEADRVLLFERWEDKPSLAVHLAAARSQPADPDAITPISAELVQYEIAAVGALGS